MLKRICYTENKHPVSLHLSSVPLARSCCSELPAQPAQHNSHIARKVYFCNSQDIRGTGSSCDGSEVLGNRHSIGNPNRAACESDCDSCSTVLVTVSLRLSLFSLVVIPFSFLVSLVCLTPCLFTQCASSIPLVVCRCCLRGLDRVHGGLDLPLLTSCCLACPSALVWPLVLTGRDEARRREKPSSLSACSQCAASVQSLCSQRAITVLSVRCHCAAQCAAQCCSMLLSALSACDHCAITVQSLCSQRAVNALLVCCHCAAQCAATVLLSVLSLCCSVRCHCAAQCAAQLLVGPERCNHRQANTITETHKTQG